jgi:hypothetical protein
MGGMIRGNLEKPAGENAISLHVPQETAKFKSGTRAVLCSLNLKVLTFVQNTLEQVLPASDENNCMEIQLFIIS